MSHSVPRGFNESVHGARGLFASFVFVYHIVNSGLPTFAVLSGSTFETYFLYSLKFGVELFFGISGYVIIGALGRSPSIRSFLWDRATRIYPVLWLSLIAISIVNFAAGRWLPPLGDWVLNFLAPPPFFPLPQLNPAAWSLGYELTFYAFCALWWSQRHRMPRWWLPGAILSGAILLLLFPRALLMAAGVAIAAGLGDRPFWKRLGNMPVLALLAFLIGWRILDLNPNGPVRDLNPLAMPFAEWFGILPLLLGTSFLGGLALLGIARGNGIAGPLLRLPTLQWLGTISYSFYLWHPVVMGAVKQVLLSTGLVDAVGSFAQLLFGVIALPPTLMVAHYSQLWVEKRFTRWLRRRGPREGDGAAPITATIEDGNIPADTFPIPADGREARRT